MKLILDSENYIEDVEKYFDFFKSFEPYVSITDKKLTENEKIKDKDIKLKELLKSFIELE